jgi:hypothetical protein
MTRFLFRKLPWCVVDFGLARESDPKFERIVCSNSFRRSEVIGLEQMDEDVYRVFFCSTELGEFNAPEMRFRPAACP